ncbi:MAG TPA: hypothetical protein VNG90_04805 [Candidatus Acidoferrum sp.]|nr:hypothetical protein [Candidatus Acidoferrum sp.]
MIRRDSQQCPICATASSLQPPTERLPRPHCLACQEEFDDFWNYLGPHLEVVRKWDMVKNGGLNHPGDELMKVARGLHLSHRLTKMMQDEDLGTESNVQVLYALTLSVMHVELNNNLVYGVAGGLEQLAKRQHEGCLSGGIPPRQLTVAVDARGTRFSLAGADGKPQVYVLSNIEGYEEYSLTLDGLSQLVTAANDLYMLAQASDKSLPGTTEG